jgi:hypothetical protein
MTDFTVAVDLIPDTADNVDYAVSVGDGRTFRLGFARDLLGVWEAELARSDHALQLDRLADDLAREILQLAPSDEQLSEGFLVALDNGFATPTAAQENLRNSGLIPFLADRTPAEVGPLPESPAPSVAAAIDTNAETTALLQETTATEPATPPTESTPEEGNPTRLPLRGVVAGIAIAAAVWLARLLLRRRHSPS